MSYTVPLPDGNKIVVLYARNFVWKDKEQSKLLDEQPASNRIYRALKMKDKNVWYLKLAINPEGKKLPIMDGIRITQLQYSTPEWECDFVEVNDMNILDLDITAEDYNQLATWADTSHSDFIRLINGPGLDIATSEDDTIDDIPDMTEAQSHEQIKEEIKNKILGVFENSLVPHTDSLISNVKYLSMRDPFMIQVLTFLTSSLIEESRKEDSVDFVSLSREIALSTEFGKGANIYAMLENIEKYAGETGTKNDLAKVAKSLIFELIRLELTR